MSALPEDSRVPSRRGAHTATLRLSGIVEQSIVDGPGLRMTVFTQGCPHRCPGCHNPETHSPRAGFEMSLSEVLSRFDENPLLSGMTLSGGEPIIQAAALAPLAAEVKRRGRNLWCYTGYTFERLLFKLQLNEALAELLRHVDVLVDGRYERDQRSLALSYRGSANQRILDMPASLAACRPVLWAGDGRFASTRLFRM